MLRDEKEGIRVVEQHEDSSSSHHQQQQQEEQVGGVEGFRNQKRKVQRRRGYGRCSRALREAGKGLGCALGALLHSDVVDRVKGCFQSLLGFALGRPVQTGLVVVNVFLIKMSLTALRRAKFAASVRVVKDLKRAEDLRYLLGQLPPWISSPEWEAGKPAQELLGLLWPALNSTICLALKNVIEDRMQSSVEYGHIKFSRFSLGRNPPVICGIKAVPLHEEDLLALVVDLDVRWAGEPDVVLRLTKISRATLGLKNLQISAMVRLVFSPIIEDPPFLQRMTVSLLNKPLIDFNLRVLGGPDIMSLPAISSWLHAAILNVTDRFLVWPKEVSVPLVPNLRQKNKALAMSAAQAWSAPLGVIVVKIEEARLQKRRSTFLGRYKLPNPRIAMITPKDDNDGVAQMTLTSVKEKTLTPSWKHSRAFVVGSENQPLRFLLSHRRVENFFGADMPLGSAEIDIRDLFDTIGREFSLESTKGNVSVKSFASAKSSKDVRDSDIDTDEFESASSTPRQSPFKHVAWASPTIHVRHQDHSNNGEDMAVEVQRPTNPLAEILSRPSGGQSNPGIEARIFKESTQVETNGSATSSSFTVKPHWTPPPKVAVPWQTDDKQAVSDAVSQFKTSAIASASKSEHCEGTTWLNINSSPAMTMSGLVNNALQPPAQVPPTPFENSLNDLSESNYAKAWLSSLKSFMMKTAFADSYDSDNDDSVPGDPDAPLEHSMFGEANQSAAKIKISYKWIPLREMSWKEDPAPRRNPNPASMSTSGVLGIRVAFTKIDYGDNPPNPILSFSVVQSAGSINSGTMYENQHQHSMYADMVSSPDGIFSAAHQRVFSTDCQVGSRPGVLHWGQVFHVPVWRADASRVRVELGNISSALKLSSYGPDLFLLEASGGSFNDDVEIEASANIPLRDVIQKGVVEGNYRLREAKTETIPGVNDDQRLDIGRIVLSMSFFPFADDSN